MNYLLDTNIIIDQFRGRQKIPPTKGNFLISLITYAELCFGAEKSTNTKKNLILIESFIKAKNIEIITLNKGIIKRYAKLRANLEKKGERIEDFDLLIASTCLEYGHTLVTRNVKHFRKIKNLKIL